jgi:Immunity protein 53
MNCEVLSMKTSNLNPLIGLCEWYAAQCDGKWEHGKGIDIRTVDNPGWRVSVNLRGTPSERVTFQEVNVENGENDWLRCFVRDGEFVGAGDPSKLSTIVEYFLSFVEIK